MMMDNTEDVEETIKRLQQEWLLEGCKGNKEKPFTPSYCYGCARTAGVAVYRKPLGKTKEKKRGGSTASKEQTTSSRRQKQSKSRTIPQVKSSANLQALARIKKKALSTLLAQKGGSAANGHSSQGNGTKKPSASRRASSRGAFPCNKCGQVFTQIYNLKRHQKRRSCVTFIREYPCTKCGKTFSVKKTFLRHVRSHNFTNNVAKYACGQCGETFSGQKPYFQHMRSHKPVVNVVITDPDLPYACDRCDKSFSRAMYLSHHKKVHDKSRPFGCQYCARMFKSQYQLTCHEDTHMNIKPYPCETCGMAFTRDSYRKVHQRVHTKTTQS